jgi:hypothetical protein
MVRVDTGTVIVAFFVPMVLDEAQGAESSVHLKSRCSTGKGRRTGRRRSTGGLNLLS